MFVCKFKKKKFILILLFHCLKQHGFKCTAKFAFFFFFFTNRRVIIEVSFFFFFFVLLLNYLRCSANFCTWCISTLHFKYLYSNLLQKFVRFDFIMGIFNLFKSEARAKQMIHWKTIFACSLENFKVYFLFSLIFTPTKKKLI